LKRLLTLVTSTSLLVGTLAAASPIDGTFALQTGTPKVRAFLRTSSVARDPLTQKLDVWLTPLAGTAPIRHYAVDMSKLLHLVMVSDDFKQFLHVHPSLGADGHFTIQQTLPVAALYHAYADDEPLGLGQQVFRFDFAVGGDAPVAARSLAPTGTRVSAGPYVVTLSTLTLTAGKDSALTVQILRNGKPARDLHPYLGAPAHAVFLDAKDLTYVHVHPGAPGSGEMDSMPGMAMPVPANSASSPPDLTLHVTVHEPGQYKLWLEFRGGAALYVAPFVLRAT
jgi:hypothetical protein